MSDIRIWPWTVLPRAPVSIHDAEGCRCQRCGSYALSVRLRDTATVVGCKDCGRAVEHQDRDTAWRLFNRPTIEAWELERVSLQHAHAAVLRGRA